MIEIKQIQRRDYQKAQSFAVEGMHLNWYLDQTWALALYSKYVWYMELNRATRAYRWGVCRCAACGYEGRDEAVPQYLALHFGEEL